MFDTVVSVTDSPPAVPARVPARVPAIARVPATDPRGASLAVHKLWLDGRLTPAIDTTLAVTPSGSSWQISGRLVDHDPFVRSYGVSLQLADGRALHGRARLVSAADGLVVFEGIAPPEGGWV